MKKILILCLMAFITVSLHSQVQTKLGAAKVDSLSFKLDNFLKWITAVSTDGTLTGNSDKKLVTEKAVKTYVDAQISEDPAGLRISIDSLADTTYVHNIRINANRALINGHTTNIASIIDSLQRHTDTMQLHNERLKYLEQGGSGFSIVLYPDANPDTVVTASSDSLAYFIIDLEEVVDSLHRHGNESILNTTTSAFTTAKNTRLEGVNDTILVIIKLTEDTLTAVEVKTGYIFPINRTFAGCNLYRVEAFSPDNGNGVAAINVYRNRGGSVVTVTSSGADIDGLATINTTYDDVALSDYYDFGFAESGASTYTIGVDVCLTFLRP